MRAFLFEFQDNLDVLFSHQTQFKQFAQVNYLQMQRPECSLGTMEHILNTYLSNKGVHLDYLCGWELCVCGYIKRWWQKVTLSVCVTGHRLWQRPPGKVLSLWRNKQEKNEWDGERLCVCRTSSITHFYLCFIMMTTINSYLRENWFIFILLSFLDIMC